MMTLSRHRDGALPFRCDVVEALVTVMIGSVPADPVPDERPVEGRPGTGDRRGRHLAWRGVWSACVVVPLVVLTPLMTQPPWSDHRLNVYGFGSAYLDRPWRLPVDVLTAVPYFLGVGNFRPLGRIVEWSLDVLVFALVDLGVPANIGLRLVGLAAAVLLTMTAALLADSVTTRGRLFAGPPSAPVVLLPFAVGAGFVAAGRMSSTIQFTGLYLFSSALVLAVAAWACRAVRAEALGVRRGVLAVLAGAGIAAFNEMACLAIPLATAAVAMRGRLVFGIPWRAAVRDPGTRFVALLWAGFLPVILPVRAIVQANCADGACYEGSDVALPGAAATVPNRLISWLPPLMWRWAADGSDGWLTGALPVVALMVLLVPAWWLLRAVPRLGLLDRRQALALAGVAAVALCLSAAVGSLNVWMQRYAVQGDHGLGWRDSALATVGGSTLVLALVAALPGARRWAGAALATLAAVAAISTTANNAYRGSSSAERFPYLHNRIAAELASFDPTADGDARRCTLRAQFLSTTAAANEHRIDQILDAAAHRVAGRRFCSTAPVRTFSVPLYRPAPD